VKHPAERDRGMNYNWRIQMSFALATWSCLTAGCDMRANESTNQTAERGQATPSTIVASYGDRQIALRDVDVAAGRSLFSLRAQTLRELIAQDLFEREAGKRGISVDELLLEEVDNKVLPPSEEELREIYEEARHSDKLMPGADFEKFKEHTTAARRQHEHSERYIDYLRELMRAAGVKKSLNALGLPRFKVAVSGDFPNAGPKDAQVTIVEYADYSSKFWRMAAPTVARLHEEMPKAVRIVFKNNPEPNNPEGLALAKGAVCAHKQGKYVEYRKWLQASEAARNESELPQFARESGVERELFESCLGKNSTAQLILQDQAEAVKYDLDGSPEFLLNGVRMSGAQPLKNFKHLIEDELETRKFKPISFI
jgi:protein-disulfide isomerase